MRTFLIIILVVILIAAGTVYYFYNQITYIPEWYGDAKYELSSENSQAARKIVNDVKQDLRSGKRVELDSGKLNALITGAIQEEKSDLKKYIKGINSRIENNRLEIETVVDISGMISQVPAEIRPVLQSVVDKLPGEALQNLFVKIEGMPEMKNGILTFGNDARLHFGGLSYSIDEINSQVQQSSGKNMDFDRILGKIPFQNLELINNKLFINP